MGPLSPSNANDFTLAFTLAGMAGYPRLRIQV